MDTYRKLFFWLFIILGAYLAIHYKHNLNDIFSQIDSSLIGLANDVATKFPYYEKGNVLLTPLIIIVGILFFILFLVFGIIYYIIKGIIWVLAKIYIAYAIIGIIFIYPFYVIFINLFELFLLLMIQHPSKSEIRRIIGRRRISDENIASISEKMMAFSGAIPHTVESEIMAGQLRVLSKMIYARAAFVKSLREKRINEAMRGFN
jgi:hypothetical protein